MGLGAAARPQIYSPSGNTRQRDRRRILQALHVLCLYRIHQLYQNRITTLALSNARRHIRRTSPFYPATHPTDHTQVKTWDKVNQGMIKMYQAEVLNKLPVIQHFLFGSILPYDGPPPPSSESPNPSGTSAADGKTIINAQGKEIFVRSDGHDHDHDHLPGSAGTGWANCCGIPVPSVFAAAAKEKREPGYSLTGPGIRPVPFD